MQHIKKKIVIFLRNNFSDYDYKRFSINYLQKNSDLVFYDLQKFFFKNIHLKKNSNMIRLKQISTYKELSRELNHDKIDHIISFIDHPRNFKEFFFYLFIKKQKKPITFIDIAPKVPGTFKRKNKIFYYFDKPRKAFKILKTFIFFKFYKIFRLNIDNVIVGGKINKKIKHKKFNNLIPSCTIDYQLYQQSKNIKIKKKKYCVFLDDDLPEHVDYKKNNLDNPVDDTDKYYKNLIFFFKKYEEVFNTHIIIAAHPKREKNYFDDFEQIYFKTPELVKSCKNVLVHASSSLSYAILNKKPIIFLTSDEINNNWMGSRIHNLVSIIKSQIFNIDDFKIQDLNKLKQEIYLNIEKYDNYKKEFLINDANTTDIWENFIKFINDKNFK